jgi:hypothetical protein
MAVTVYAPPMFGTPNEQKFTHSDGMSIDVQEGHLLVKRAAARAGGSGKRLAVYAPGQWLRAEYSGGGSGEES